MAVKWGVLGTAGIARGCTIPGMQEADNCELYAIAGRNEEKANAFKQEVGFKKVYAGYDKLLEDPDVQAVYIPLPNHLHKEWVIKALKSGKHVLCEKPMALNAEDAKEMFDAAKENNVILMEAYAYLHSPYIASLKADLKSGIIGDVDYIETEFLTQGYVEDIRIHKEMGGGAVYDLGCYCTWRDHLNLIPFRQIWLYWHGRAFSIAAFQKYLVSMPFWQLLFNILLTVPFGVYMHYYFKLSLKRTVLYSFLLSLFYEISQLTALFGIYPGHHTDWQTLRT